MRSQHEGKVLDLTQLYAALDRKRTKLKISWRTLGSELGVYSSIFTRLKAGKCIQADVFVLLCAFINRNPASFTRPGWTLYERS